ncbi:hypothetical protein [uncultured Lacinutrix sp.]|uniref:hypothetical protein n=1 Tax=uncultured Lacinutrix sp. TaxID=574032 RepID=UPI0026067CBF|nr:hypothetical protein [uncultured Lacinutrix sp.]
MTVFDQIFYFIFTRYKARFKQKANTLALVYTSLFQIALVFLLGCFFAAFFSQMNFETMSSDKTWILFILTSIGLHIKNWIKYNGKTRKVMNARFNKKKSPKYNLALLIALPFICMVMGFVFLQAL